MTSPPLATYELDPLSFFDDNPKGLVPLAQGPDRAPEEEARILRFIRTPEGRGVGVVRTDGGEVWQTPANGSNLLKRGRWPAADLVVVLQNGTDSFHLSVRWHFLLSAQANSLQHTLLQN